MQHAVAKDARRYTVLYLPGLEEMAVGVAKQLGDSSPVLCTSSLSDPAFEGTSLCWGKFPSGDPDIKVRVRLQ